MLRAVLRHDETDGVWYAELENEPRVHTFGATAPEALQQLADAAALWYEDEES